MAGKGNPIPGPHLNGFPMPPYSYFFPHMLGGLSPPALPGLPLSGYSTPSPASKYPPPGARPVSVPAPRLSGCVWFICDYCAVYFRWLDRWECLLWISWLRLHVGFLCGRLAYFYHV